MLYARHGSIPALGVFRSSCKIKEIQLCQRLNSEVRQLFRRILWSDLLCVILLLFLLWICLFLSTHLLCAIARGKYFNYIGIFILFKRVSGWHGQTLFGRA
jgi:hypothetical protein